MAAWTLKSVVCVIGFGSVELKVGSVVIEIVRLVVVRTTLVWLRNRLSHLPGLGNVSWLEYES